MFAWVDRMVRIVGGAVLTALGLSVAWVGFYAHSNPYETVLMGIRTHAGQEVTHDWVPLHAISPHLVRAVIAAEDTKFCAHFGYDIAQIKAAMKSNKTGDSLRGASTISQQTAKNVFLWPGRTMIRKGGEAWFTLLMEVMWPKERIMEVYLNVAEWGDGLFGAEAAAQARFGISAKDLNATQAALLAAVLPNPKDWRVNSAGPYVSSRSITLRQRMALVREQRLDACVLH